MVTVAEFNRSQRAKSVNQPGFGSIASNQGGGPAGMTFGEAASVSTPTGAIQTFPGEFAQAQSTIDKNEPATAGGETADQLRKRLKKEREEKKEKEKTPNKFIQEILEAGEDIAKMGGVAGLIIQGGAAGLDTLFQKLFRTKPTAELLNDPRTLAVLNREFAKDPTGQLKQSYKDLYGDVIDEAYESDIEQDFFGTDNPLNVFDIKLDQASAQSEAGGLGKGSQRINFPSEFYKDFQPQTSGDLVNLASLDASANPELADRIFAARAELDRMGKNPFTGTSNQGIMAASPALPGLPVTPPVTPPGTTPPAQPPIPAPIAGITPFNINQFYASLPTSTYSQQGVMSPNLAQFYQNLGLFPRV